MTTARILPPGPPQHEDLPDARQVLLRPLNLDLGVLLEGVDHDAFECLSIVDGHTHLTVEAGFDHDGSSYPWYARPIFPAKTGRLAGIAHDKAYRVQIPRVPADRIWWIVARSGSEQPDAPKAPWYKRLVGRNGYRHLGPVRGFLGWAGLSVGGWLAYWKRGRELARSAPSG